MRALNSTSIIALIALSPTLAEAQATRACCREVPKWYGAVSTNVVFLEDSDYSVQSGPPGYATPDFQTFKTGYGFSGALGYQLYPKLRAELEVAYRISDVDQDPANPVGNGSRTRRSINYMANMYYDFRNSTNYTPYIGTGVGLVDVKTNRIYTRTFTGESTKALQDWAVAYQFMAGLSYRFNLGVSPVEAILGYRYVDSSDLESDKLIPSIPGTATFTNSSHNLELGARMYF